MNVQKTHIREEEEEMNRITGDTEEKKQKKLSSGKRGGVSGGGTSSLFCQAEKCTVDMTDAKRYHRRHKVCDFHAKAASVIVSGLRQRFCQQCSRFHELVEFDEAKRSCRRRLAGHNERRRKTTSESQEGGSSSRTKPEHANPQCRPPDNVATRLQTTTYPSSSTYKHFQTR